MERKSKSSKNYQILALETFSSDSFLSINKCLLSHFGPSVSIFLCNLIDKYKYFIKEEKLQEDGSFFLIHLDQTVQTGMNEYELRKCKKILKKEGILNTYMSGIPPKEFYILNIDTLIDNFLRNIPLNFEGKRVENSKEKGVKIRRNIKENKYKENKLTTNTISRSRNKEKIYKHVTEPKQNIPVSEEENEVPASDKSNGFITPALFDEFWQIYPRKVDKGKAKTIWNRLCNRKKDCPQWDTLRTALIEQKKSERWQEAKFTPHPSTWLNQSRWEDDPGQMKCYKMENFQQNQKKPDNLYKEEGRIYSW